MDLEKNKFMFMVVRRKGLAPPAEAATISEIIEVTNLSKYSRSCFSGGGGSQEDVKNSGCETEHF